VIPLVAVMIGVFRCHSVAIARVFCGSFCPFVASALRSVTAHEVREVAGKVVVAPTGFESHDVDLPVTTRVLSPSSLDAMGAA
jgi:hypothetical protein